MAKPIKHTLADGRTVWRARVELGRDPVTGARKQRTLSAPTLKALDAKITRAKSAALRGEASASTMTVRTYLLEHWLPHKARGGLRDQTLGNYRGDVLRHLLPAFGATKLGQLETIAIQAWVNGQDARPSTIRQRLLTLRMACKQAVRWRLLPHNPCDGVTAPKVTYPPRPLLAAAERERLVDALGDDALDVACRLLVRTGLRIGEAATLQWGDLSGRVLTVRRTLTTGRGADGGARVVVGATTKTGAPRQVLLDGETAARVAALPRVAVWCFPGGRDRSRPVTARAISERLARRCREAGLPALTAHDLRHGHATDLLRAGVDARVAMARLGHTSLAMLAHYSHPDVHDQEGATRLAPTSDQPRQSGSGGR